MYCILQVFVMLGFPTRIRVKLSFLQIWLTKAGGTKEGPVLFSHWSAVNLSSQKVRAEVEKQHVGVFSYLSKTQM